MAKHYFLTLCILLAALGLCPLSFAEAPDLITAIEVEGNSVVSTNTILTKIKTRPGDRLNQQTVNEDIKRLYATGFFTDASAEIRDYKGGKMVRFGVKERPLVGSVVITGVRHFREMKLRETINTKEQQLLDRRELKQDLERIKQLYRTKGFYLADIAHEVKVDEETNKATVYLTITEGQKIRVRSIRFEGNEAFSAGRLRKAMATKQAWWWFTSGYYRPEVLEEDVERVKGLYRSEGYSDVEAYSEVSFDESRRWLSVLVGVTEGTQYLVGGITFRGMRELGPEQFEKDLELKTGEPFNQEKLYTDVAMIQSAYFARGYMAAEAQPGTVLNRTNNRIDTTFTISEGAVAYVGQILVRGNVKTKDAVIRRELRIAPGEQFDGEKLRRSKERLYNLGFFEEVSMETVPSKSAERRDLVVSVKEAKTGELSFGGGFSSVDNFIGFGEVVQRNFDLFNWPNFVGAGQELRFQLMAGTRRRNLELSFTDPWVFNRPYLFGFDLYNTTRTRGEGYSFELKRRGGALRLGRAFGDFDRVDFTYRLESDRVSDLADSASQALKDEAGDNSISSVLFSYTRDTRDNIFNPRKGYFSNTGIRVAGSVLGGDRDFWQWTGTGSLFFEPLVAKQVLELRATVGLSEPFDDSNAVPIFERFFAGGADSIRGYKERRVGPRDSSTRDPIGGESMAVFNAEYTVPVVDFLKSAAFVDVGNVWDDLENFATGGFKSGVGAGVRVKTPFGPVKLDYGWPLNPDAGEKDTGRLHFSASRSF